MKTLVEALIEQRDDQLQECKDACDEFIDSHMVGNLSRMMLSLGMIAGLGYKVLLLNDQIDHALIAKERPK